MEDSGGVWNWEMNEEVSPFDRKFVEKPVPSDGISKA